MPRLALSSTLAVATALLIALSGARAHAESPDQPTTQREEVPPTAAEYLQVMLDRAGPRRCFEELQLSRRDLPGQLPAERAEGDVPLRRLVLAVDASGSMAGAAGGERKMDAARRAALDFLAEVPPEVEVGILVFGHRGSPRSEGKAASCASAEPLAEIGSGNRARVRAAVQGLRPMGWTPLAAAIERAAAMFQPSEVAGEQVLLVISDGVETCGGDPVAAARALRSGPVRVVVNIVGFDIRPAERDRLAAVAEAGGGRFLNAGNGRELAARLREARNAARAREAQFRAIGDTARTRIAADGAAGRARVCVALLQNRERQAVAAGFARDAAGGRLSPDLREEAQALLDRRHRALDQALENYATATGAVRDAQLDDIDRALERALAPAQLR